MMDSSDSSVLPWHIPVWEQLASCWDNLPHALLLHGMAGTGKREFAEHLAKSLLCENRKPDRHACSSCPACGWFDQYAHPDYRRILPPALDADRENDAEKMAEEGDEKSSSRTGSAPSRRIGIDQIRELWEMLSLSTHRGGLKPVCLWPAEALTAESANALLKMLEEPPQGTVFILVANSLQALLPTILSRCRKIAMPMPETDEALAWLKEQGVDDAQTWLAGQGGAPLAALDEAQSGSHEERDAFLAALARPGVETALQTAEKLQRVLPRQIIAWLQRWLYDLFALRMSGRQRYFPCYRQILEGQAASLNLDELLRLMRKTARRNRIAEHPLVLRLLIEDMLLEYTRLFPEKGRR
ncbi:MAG: DNA polymerase III subunit delta' [Alistipes senegalensis]|nr:DNA polymerase III subunit delta' [Oxalobacter formigenes]MCM1281140.1 DNA polymerase III subunit delta' [Alistipes senegalensis]